MNITRRAALTLAGGVALGAAGAVAANATVDAVDAANPLPFYGSAVSGIHADRSAPSVASTRIVWAGPPHAKKVALTFDDGPHPDWTPRVLAALAAAKVPATFFCVGRQVREHADLHRASVGWHELANHTYTHPDLGRLDAVASRDEIDRTNETMARAYGSAPTLFRPPYGHLGGAAVLAAAEAGLTTVLWSAQAREDVFADQPDGVVDDIVRQLRPGSIILAHDTGKPNRLVTIDRIVPLVERARSAGYSFTTLSDLLTGGATPS